MGSYIRDTLFVFQVIINFRVFQTFCVIILDLAAAHRGDHGSHYRIEMVQECLILSGSDRSRIFIFDCAGLV